MKVQILSDLHLEGGIPSFFKTFKPSGDVLLLVGDITSWKRKGLTEEVFGKLDLPVLYILGNHEYYWGNWDRTLDDYREWYKDTNIKVMDCEITKIGNTFFIGATYWSDISYLDELDVKKFVTDYKIIEDCTVDKQRQAHHLAKLAVTSLVEYARKEDPSAKIVIFTHFPPSYQAQEPRFKFSGLSSYFYNNDEDLVSLLNPDLWVYGHTHGNLRFNIRDVPVTTNQMGYVQGSYDNLKPEPCYKDFNINYVVEV